MTQARESAMTSAALSVGDVETVYRRAGSGAPVVLLGLQAETEAELVERLARPGGRWRAIVPAGTTLTALATDGAVDESTFARWLSGFLQGLGLDCPHVVATGPFREELERFAEAHPEELGPVLIVDDREGSAGAVAERLEGH